MIQLEKVKESLCIHCENSATCKVLERIIDLSPEYYVDACDEFLSAEY